MVLSNDYRHPALLAHEATTLHAISGGRFELGLGAGWYQPEYSAAGIAFDPAGRRIDRLEETLDILTRLFRGEVAHHTGPTYSIDVPPRRPVRCLPIPRCLPVLASVPGSVSAGGAPTRPGWCRTRSDRPGSRRRTAGRGP